MAKSILKEALQDAKLLQETALQNAKNVLVEAISPQIKEFIDSQIGESEKLDEMPSTLREMGMDLDQEQVHQLIQLLQKMTGGGGMEEPSLGGEEVGSGLSGLGDMGGEEEEEEESPLEGMYEGEEKEDKEEEEEEMAKQEETVKIDEQDLKKAWEEVVREEALEEASNPSPSVSEFGVVQNPNSNAKGGLGEPGTPGERGLEDKEKEKMWKDEEAPAAQDWTVQEGKYRSTIASLRKENKDLYSGMEQLRRKLSEVNLFNSKLMHTNKLLQKTNLTNEQRLTVIEAFDRAESLREVELVYSSLSESFKIAGVLSEGKQLSHVSRASRFTTSATANLMREQSNKSEGKNESDPLKESWARLAGILKE